MYAFSGPAVAKFVQGQYDFVLGFAWIPWVVAFLLLAVRTRRAHTALAALSVALLFFAGNLYYSYYLLYVVALFAATAVLTILRGPS